MHTKARNAAKMLAAVAIVAVVATVVAIGAIVARRHSNARTGMDELDALAYQLLAMCEHRSEHLPPAPRGAGRASTASRCRQKQRDAEWFCFKWCLGSAPSDTAATRAAIAKL